jgi:hypothetical protein
MIYIRRIYRTMIETDWSRDRARPLLESVRENHHPVTVAAMERLLKQAGL